MFGENSAKTTATLLCFIPTALILSGCASSSIKYDASSVTSEDKLGILFINDSYPLIFAGGGMPSAIYDSISGDKETLRRKLRETLQAGGNNVTETLVQNWPSSFPPNPKIIQKPDIVRSFWASTSGIDFSSTAKKNELDVLLYIQVHAELTCYGSSENWTSKITLSGAMMRSSNRRKLWTNRVSRKSLVTRQSMYASGSDWDELRDEFVKLIGEASTELLADILPGESLGTRRGQPPI